MLRKNLEICCLPGVIAVLCPADSMLKREDLEEDTFFNYIRSNNGPVPDPDFDPVNVSKK